MKDDKPSPIPSPYQIDIPPVGVRHKTSFITQPGGGTGWYGGGDDG